MREFLQMQGVSDATINAIQSWIEWIGKATNADAGPLVSLILEASREAHQRGAASMVSPLVGATPAPPASMPAPPPAPYVVLPQFTLGRTPKGLGPGPVAASGPVPANVQISAPGQPFGAGGAARVQITPGPAGQIPSPQDAYQGTLQPGYQRVAIEGPNGEKQEIIVNDQKKIISGTATPALLDGSPLVNPPPAPPQANAIGTLAGAMDSVKIAGGMGPKMIEALEAIERGEDHPKAPMLAAVGLVELEGDAFRLSQKAREAMAIAKNRLKESGHESAPLPARRLGRSRAGLGALPRRREEKRDRAPA